MTESLNENEKVLVLCGLNRWGFLQGNYARCAEPWNKIYIIKLDGKEFAYKREQFLTIPNLILILAELGAKVIFPEDL